MKLPIWSTIYHSLILTGSNLFKTPAVKYLPYFVLVEMILKNYLPMINLDNMDHNWRNLDMTLLWHKGILTFVLNTFLSVYYYAFIRYLVNGEQISPLPDKRDLKAIWYSYYIILRAIVLPIIGLSNILTKL